MQDKLTNRVGRIISGSLNSLVSALENSVPEAVLEEALREIDAATDELRTELGKVIAQRHLAERRLTAEKRTHHHLSGQIEIAISEQRDDLAKAAIARQLDIEAQIPVLETAIEECNDQEQEEEGYIRALLARKRQMQEELRQFQRDQSQRRRPRSGDSSSAAGPCTEEKVARAESTFDRIMHHGAGQETIGSADRQRSASQLAELEELTRKNRIEERMAAIKGQMTREE